MLSYDGRARTSPFSRIGGFAGIGFALLIVTANAVMVPAGLPAPGSGAEEAAAFFRRQTTAVGIGSALVPAAWVLATLFGAAVVAALRRAERTSGEAWSLLGFAGVVLQNAAFAAVVATRLALTREDAEAAALWALHDALFALNGAFLALALTGLSIGGLRAGLVRPWHAAVGLLSATLLLSSATLALPVVAGAEGVGLLGLAGWALWVVWTIAYGAALIRCRPSDLPVDTVGRRSRSAP
ncbi:2-oxoglutarate/malate transporter [Streptomyces sp. NPDC049906]|uniref:2-oxoglutarate/malate transporter n=1 Tax=Streptomyces sp. NPDC049906 TaxID=3155656 RepID=UPI003418375D